MQIGGYMHAIGSATFCGQLAGGVIAILGG
jgi:hypothetical protein